MWCLLYDFVTESLGPCHLIIVVVGLEITLQSCLRLSFFGFFFFLIFLKLQNNTDSANNLTVNKLIYVEITTLVHESNDYAELSRYVFCFIAEIKIL